MVLWGWGLPCCETVLLASVDREDNERAVMDWDISRENKLSHLFYFIFSKQLLSKMQSQMCWQHIWHVNTEGTYHSGGGSPDNRCGRRHTVDHTHTANLSWTSHHSDPDRTELTTDKSPSTHLVTNNLNVYSFRDRPSANLTGWFFSKINNLLKKHKVCNTDCNKVWKNEVKTEVMRQEKRLTKVSRIFHKNTEILQTW